MSRGPRWTSLDLVGVWVWVPVGPRVCVGGYNGHQPAPHHNPCIPGLPFLTKISSTLVLQLNQLRESSDRDMAAAKKQVEDLEMRLEEARKKTAATERYKDYEDGRCGLLSQTLFTLLTHLFVISLIN